MPECQFYIIWNSIVAQKMSAGLCYNLIHTKDTDWSSTLKSNFLRCNRS